MAMRAAVNRSTVKLHKNPAEARVCQRVMRDAISRVATLQAKRRAVPSSAVRGPVGADGARCGGEMTREGRLSILLLIIIRI